MRLIQYIRAGSRADEGAASTETTEKLCAMGLPLLAVDLGDHQPMAWAGAVADAGTARRDRKQAVTSYAGAFCGLVCVVRDSVGRIGPRSLAAARVGSDIGASCSGWILCDRPGVYLVVCTIGVDVAAKMGLTCAGDMRGRDRRWGFVLAQAQAVVGPILAFYGYQRATSFSRRSQAV